MEAKRNVRRSLLKLLHTLINSLEKSKTVNVFEVSVTVTFTDNGKTFSLHIYGYWTLSCAKRKWKEKKKRNNPIVHMWKREWEDGDVQSRAETSGQQIGLVDREKVNRPFFWLLINRFSHFSSTHAKHSLFPAPMWETSAFFLSYMTVKLNIFELWMVGWFKRTIFSTSPQAPGKL